MILEPKAPKQLPELRPQLLEVTDADRAVGYWDISQAPEMNIPLFEGQITTFVSRELIETGEYGQLIDRLQPKSLVAMELELGTDQEASECVEGVQARLNALLEPLGRRVLLSDICKDPEDKSIASVVHYFSGIKFLIDTNRTASSLKEAHGLLEADGAWQSYADRGVGFVAGPDIDPDLLHEIWDCYDKTFDKLVERHPSAQKQPIEYFKQQTTMQGANVLYVRDETGRIVSEVFSVEDSALCPWLEHSYFEQMNPDGKTMYLPGIATRLDLKGAAHSATLVKALTDLVARDAQITAIATQCTNRSSHYIPKIITRYALPTVEVSLATTQNIIYPVFEVISLANIGTSAVSAQD